MTHTVLVVDDDPNILFSLEFLLSEAGYAVQTAHDGEAALAAVERARPALVLLDIDIPKLNGYEVCARLREDPRWRRLRIVMVTADGHEIEREKGRSAGADDYLVKPFSTEALVGKVRGLLGSD